MIKKILKTLRINHYIKNIIVFIPLIFSANFLHYNTNANSFIMFLAFCTASSAVYILNDLIDINSDKKHPIKSKRPIAKGEITQITAIIIFILLLTIATTLAFVINTKCLFAICLYFILNILYSLYLKKIVLIDSTCIALGFIIRILSGYFAIKVVPSPLIILTTFFISNFFTCIKRKLEIQMFNSSNKLRNAISKIDINTINQFITINSVLSISLYITYVLDESTIQKAGSHYLYLTVVPFTLIVFRLFLLINTVKIDDDPIIYIEQDKMTKFLIWLYFIILLLVITFLK